MKYFKYFTVFIGIISILIAGCSNSIGNVEQTIKVEKRIGNENKYEDFKEITDMEQVHKVQNMLGDIDWENTKVEMVHPADYTFSFQYKNPKIEAKTVLYKLWVNTDKVELVITNEHKYGKLNKSKSTELFQMLTGEKLANPK